uniref:Uncharacterized protein n=1 Tax=Cyclophora tenuis TaxID=216820 RepID=A0A7S1CZD8_CYCTE
MAAAAAPSVAFMAPVPAPASILRILSSSRGKQGRRMKDGGVGHLFHDELATLYEEEDDDNDTINNNSHHHNNDNHGQDRVASSSSSMCLGSAKKRSSIITNTVTWADEINIKARWEYALQTMMGVSCTDPLLEILANSTTAAASSPAAILPPKDHQGDGNGDSKLSLELAEI